MKSKIKHTKTETRKHACTQKKQKQNQIKQKSKRTTKRTKEMKDEIKLLKRKPGGGVKMAVWKDMELVSPHSEGTCRPLVGDSDDQGDGRNPKVNR